jgi:hypothetical protein|tara:strand:- start:160 stop:822 length:663 start_codon:yes stop_codon:yes gene_type:complete
MNFLVRKVHKYLSFFISLQLLLWTVSGIYFAFNKIELVRGEQYRKQVEQSINLGDFDFEIPNTTDVSIQKRLGENIAVIKVDGTTKYLNRSGESISKLTQSEAMNLVISNTTLSPVLVEEIVNERSGSEYRGRSLPIYKVESKTNKDLDINVYLNVYSGEVLAIRSNQWRIWDLMWGLHIMDWKERDNISNILLKIFSILALVSSVTGVMLFFKLDFKKQ